MARDPAGDLGDQHELADRRLDVGLQRHAADRDVHHFAMHDLAVGAGEFGEALLVGALVTAQHAVIHQGLVEEQDQLLGGAFALGRGADEGDAEAIAVAAHHIAFEAAETVDIEHDRRAGLGNDLADDGGAAGRQVGNGAAGFAAVGRDEQAARQVDPDAAKAPALGPRLGDDRFGVLHGHRQALHGPAPIVNVSGHLYPRQGQQEVTGSRQSRKIGLFFGFRRLLRGLRAASTILKQGPFSAPARRAIGKAGKICGTGRAGARIQRRLVGT